jgi:hypothetical protein
MTTVQTKRYKIVGHHMPDPPKVEAPKANPQIITPVASHVAPVGIWHYFHPNYQHNYNCGALIATNKGTFNPRDVTCNDCRKFMGLKSKPDNRTHGFMGAKYTGIFACGEKTGPGKICSFAGGTTALISCEGCLKAMVAKSAVITHGIPVEWDPTYSLWACGKNMKDGGRSSGTSFMPRIDCVDCLIVLNTKDTYLHHLVGSQASQYTCGKGKGSGAGETMVVDNATCSHCYRRARGETQTRTL